MDDAVALRTGAGAAGVTWSALCGTGPLRAAGALVTGAASGRI